MKKLLFFAIAAMALLAAQAAWGQQVDLGFGAGTTFSPSAASASGSFTPQSMGSGTYLDFSGDVLFWHNLGVEGDVSWRASQNAYYGIQPFRPIFYDFNAIYAPPLGEHARLELLGGLGGSSTRFYTPYYNCSYYYCTNYVSSNHFMGDVGVGLRLYAKGGFFIRPEVREYFIHNNFEFSSGHLTRAGVSIGYSFGGRQ